MTNAPEFDASQQPQQPTEPPAAPQYPAPGAYQYTPPQYLVPPQRETNGMGVASFVLSILWLFGVGSILAVIFGHVARRQVRDEPTRFKGNGLATAGLAIGYTSIGIGVFFLLVLIGAASSSS